MMMMTVLKSPEKEILVLDSGPFDHMVCHIDSLSDP